MVRKRPSNAKATSDTINTLPLQLSRLSIQETEVPKESKPALRNGSKKSKSEVKKQRKEIVDRWAQYFGEESKLENWQKLCYDLGIDPVPTSLTKCRNALKKGIWVNIYDFLDNLNSNMPQNYFNSEKELAEYTMRTGKIYPKKKAKEGGPVRDLLAHIFRGDQRSRRH